ncbi:hypothetical protein Gasu2_41080 [Galdieria sulphuraria]|uniref:Uncharacterized protein n=1 Tax=Galdieria sulphuraria TaxID=130081 RepID=M2Y7I7_GALSU|nr:uncharacterized protein Gasu_07640 [Galdieria sulphuraria]EME32018.1 hypothetical protein Gasu_07640 [Galdieria sulphuraria]GJD09885.1 hypothetical protein Gasu2_41080 [Galdieria sulphuraria]|eukprot:XP_005708538.1 hypothetical protein Gasu_07640 [Galdieria sulphuraria]
MSHQVVVTIPDLYGKHNLKQPYFILIGIQEADKDYILDAIPLSPKVDSSTHQEQIFGELETTLQHLSRSVPCGLNILGISILNNMEQNILTLESTLYIFKRYWENYGHLYKWKRALLLNVDERKPVCKLIDLQFGGKSVICKLKDSNRAPPLYCLETIIDLDWTVPCFGEESSVISWLSEANQSFCSRLADGFAFVDECYLCHKNQPDDWFLPQDRKHYQVKILTDQWFPGGQESHSFGDSAMRLLAQVPCRVYSVGKIRGNQIVPLFLQDWKQSFEAIIQIALEEFGASSFDLFHSKLIWNLPKRIFTENSLRTVPYCDYVLCEETCQNIKERMSSLLGFSSKELEQTKLCFFRQKGLSESDSLPSSAIWQLHALESSIASTPHQWNSIPNRLWIGCILVVMLGILLATFWRNF